MVKVKSQFLKLLAVACAVYVLVATAVAVFLVIVPHPLLAASLGNR
jgi:hypothetical protein